jgi:hypothetical protein
MSVIWLSKPEKQFVVLLAKYRRREGTIIKDDVAEHRTQHLTNFKVRRSMKKLEGHNLVFSVKGDESYNLSPEIERLAWIIENPKQPDRWEEFKLWFFSQWWSVPLMTVTVIVPILAAWYKLGVEAYGWISGG